MNFSFNFLNAKRASQEDLVMKASECSQNTKYAEFGHMHGKLSPRLTIIMESKGAL